MDSNRHQSLAIQVLTCLLRKPAGPSSRLDGSGTEKIPIHLRPATQAASLTSRCGQLIKHQDCRAASTAARICSHTGRESPDLFQSLSYAVASETNARMCRLVVFESQKPPPSKSGRLIRLCQRTLTAQ